VVHRTEITNLDTYGLSRNPSPLDEDLTGAKWHGDYDQEVGPDWHAVVYLTLFSSVVVEVPIEARMMRLINLKSLRYMRGSSRIPLPSRRDFSFVYLGNGKK
jgi:hypothetical protein